MITKLKRALEALESSIPYHLLDRVYPPIEGLRTVIAQLEQAEPVAWVNSVSLQHIQDYDITIYGRGGFDDAVPLYAAPVQPVREVLTDEQIDRCIEAADARWADSFVPVQWARHLAKAIEAAHGITKD